MSYDVRHYELPEHAGAADRITLSLWKTWATWLCPLLLLAVLMTVVSAIVGTFIAKSGGFVAVWSPANYSAAVPIGGESLAEMNSPLWTRGIVAQLASVVAALLVAWPVLRRTAIPASVGALSGLLVVVTHVTRSHQWGLRPIVEAPFGYQVAALISLWVLPVAAGALGAFIASRRRRDED